MRRSNIALAVGAGLLASGVQALAADPLAQADVVSAIGLARVADEVGDSTLASWLKSPARRDLALTAVRASPFAWAPERLVVQLAPVLCGRDPILAPEASIALVQIAERLQPSLLAAREAASYDVKMAREALACVKQQPSPRADLMASAMLLDAALAQLTAPQ